MLQSKSGPRRRMKSGTRGDGNRDTYERFAGSRFLLGSVAKCCHSEPVRTLAWESVRQIGEKNGLPHQSADWFAMTGRILQQELSSEARLKG